MEVANSGDPEGKHFFSRLSRFRSRRKQAGGAAESPTPPQSVSPQEIYPTAESSPSTRSLITTEDTPPSSSPPRHDPPAQIPSNGSRNPRKLTLRSTENLVKLRADLHESQGQHQLVSGTGPSSGNRRSGPRSPAEADGERGRYIERTSTMERDTTGVVWQHDFRSLPSSPHRFGPQKHNFGAAPAGTLRHKTSRDLADAHYRSHQSTLSAIRDKVPSSAINSRERRVQVRYGQQTIVLPITPSSIPSDLLATASTPLGLPSSSDRLRLKESYSQLGLTRPIREFERIRGIMNCWDHDGQNSLVIENSQTSDHLRDLRLEDAPQAPPVKLSATLYHSQQPGRWAKRFVTIHPDGLLESAKSEASSKDVRKICNMSGFDVYQPTARQVSHIIKPPQRYCFAIKSQEKASMFLDASGYVHILATGDQATADAWQQTLQQWKSWYLVDRMGGPEALSEQLKTRHNPQRNPDLAQARIPHSDGRPEPVHHSSSGANQARRKSTIQNGSRSQSAGPARAPPGHSNPLQRAGRNPSQQRQSSAELRRSILASTSPPPDPQHQQRQRSMPFAMTRQHSLPQPRQQQQRQLNQQHQPQLQHQQPPSQQPPSQQSQISRLNFPTPPTDPKLRTKQGPLITVSQPVDERPFMAQGLLAKSFSVPTRRKAVGIGAGGAAPISSIAEMQEPSSRHGSVVT